MTAEQSQVIDAVLYALKSGCFFPVPEPQPGATVQDLVQWGAMRNLHTSIAELGRAGLADRRLYRWRDPVEVSR